ncbi:hypothetical protein TWF225_011853 [Orbilia oligospora]|uniref:Uncharacterized protein n=1 Tax=Orbilia oligospora TaxID=2813651 RepID=A0A8H2HN45_ORBOL|nr:hypothetical protein TWF225_011853 [Orbilia oligospora]KAF3253373.1 hypothetical protein TWF128_006457 [Orbilia oligospora]KAF3263729.1 hypothetical protein TWF217_003441 [Orbilia oligospora]KAF3285787.1 hypothetical protein TWF132_009148 [Orbilia oligospora]TGJ65041.1 hypothetical protein EYR41_009046 [Orbilia oligospora]
MPTTTSPPKLPTRQTDENTLDNNDTPKESKPSLTVLGHKLSEQISDHNKGLTTSMKGILESRNAISDIIKDVKSLVNTQHESWKQLLEVTEKIQKAVTTNTAHSELILTGLAELKNLHEDMSIRNAFYTAKANASIKFSEELVQDQRDTTESTIEMNKKLDRVLEEFEIMKTKNKSYKPGRSRKLKKKPRATLLEPDGGEQSVLSTTEITIDTDDTGEYSLEPAKKKARKTTQRKKIQRTGPSQATRSRSGAKSLPGTQQKPTTRRSRRQRSISLGATIDSDPRFNTPNQPASFVVEETPEQSEPDAFQEQQSERIPETVASSSKPEPEPKTPPQKPMRKRMLAGPATQEAWEMDSTST